MSGERSQKGADEIYCRACGEIIKQEAEICPHCGVRNTAGGGSRHRSTAGRSTASGSGGGGTTIDDIAPGVAWVAGALLVLVAVGVFLDPAGQVLRAAVAGLVLLATGLFCLPPVRRELNEALDVEFTRGIVILVVLVGLVLGIVISPDGEPAERASVEATAVGTLGATLERTGATDRRPPHSTRDPSPRSTPSASATSSASATPLAWTFRVATCR